MHIKPFEFGFARRRSSDLCQAAKFCQGLGFLLPGIYLPTLARAIGAALLASALAVLLLNVADVFGCAAMGSLSDHLDVTSCLVVSAAGTALGTFLLWGLATSLPVLLLFCVINSLFAGSYSLVWTRIMRQDSLEPAPAAKAGGRAIFESPYGAGHSVGGPLSQLRVFFAAISQGYPSSNSPCVAPEAEEMSSLTEQNPLVSCFGV